MTATTDFIKSSIKEQSTTNLPIEEQGLQHGAIKDFIWTKDRSLSHDFCKHIIEKFDKDDRKRPGVVGREKKVKAHVKDTMDLNISHFDGWEDEDSVYFKALSNALVEYSAYLGNLNPGIACWPSQDFLTNDTGYKIQMYEPNAQYTWHHDWSMTGGWQGGKMSDAPIASRIFTFIWYLNTIPEKNNGFTEFADGTRIQPKRGRIVLFPATWTYLHRGAPTKSGRKYITNGWIFARPRCKQVLSPLPEDRF